MPIWSSHQCARLWIYINLRGCSNYTQCCLIRGQYCTATDKNHCSPQIHGTCLTCTSLTVCDDVHFFCSIFENFVCLCLFVPLWIWERKRTRCGFSDRFAVFSWSSLAVQLILSRLLNDICESEIKSHTVTWTGRRFTRWLLSFRSLPCSLSFHVSLRLSSHHYCILFSLSLSRLLEVVFMRATLIKVTDNQKNIYFLSSHFLSLPWGWVSHLFQLPQCFKKPFLLLWKGEMNL